VDLSNQSVKAEPMPGARDDAGGFETPVDLLKGSAVFDVFKTCPGLELSGFW
jgi:hypothetical protein